MCDQTCIIVSAVVGGIVFLILLVLAIWCFLRVSRIFGYRRDQAISRQRTATVRVHVWLSDQSKRLGLIILNFLNQIRKKRQQGGVYNPQEMENKDYKRKGNIDINSISMQVQPERLI